MACGDSLLFRQAGTAIDQLIELSRQAALPAAERAKGVSLALVKALGSTLAAARSLAEVWSMWGETIKGFFGIER
jgi:hypothetical protein